MFKRIMLALTFVAAFSATTVCVTNKVEARWGGWSRPHTSYYYGPRSYTYGVPYRTYYNGYNYSGYNGYYGTRPYYSSYYGAPGYYYYRSVPRVAIQVGPYWR